MKVKNLEREIERKFETCLGEFSNLATLYVAYTEKATDERQERFADKLEKKYGKELDRFKDIIDILL